jgi:hypothetical protein
MVFNLFAVFGFVLSSIFNLTSRTESLRDISLSQTFTGVRSCQVGVGVLGYSKGRGGSSWPIESDEGIDGTVGGEVRHFRLETPSKSILHI